MKMQLLPLIFSAILCTREYKCPEIDMKKLYKITQTPATGTPSDIEQKIPGIEVVYCSNDQLIVISFNTPNDQLTQTVNLTIAAAENVKPNLLTIKTTEDIEPLITINADKTAVNVALGVNTPEGKIVLEYNGDVDVKRTSPDADLATEQTYILKNPYFINQTTPFDTTATNANFKLSNVTAYDYLLCAFYETMRYLNSFFCCVRVPEDCLCELSKTYCAEKLRNEMSKRCCKTGTTKVCQSTPILNIVDCENICKPIGNFNLERWTKPTTCVQKDSLSVSITNAIAITTIFEFIDVSCEEENSFFAFMKDFVNIDVTLSIQDSCSIMYNVIESFCDSSDRKKIYLDVVSSLGINIKTLYTPSIESDASLKTCLSTHIPSCVFEDVDTGDVVTTETVEETAEETQESETSESEKKKKESKGMSTTKKVIIASVVVVVVVSVTVGAVAFFT